jgi:hypothetical protein
LKELPTAVSIDDGYLVEPKTVNMILIYEKDGVVDEELTNLLFPEGKDLRDPLKSTSNLRWRGSS